MMPIFAALLIAIGGPAQATPSLQDMPIDVIDFGTTTTTECREHKYVSVVTRVNNAIKTLKVSRDGVALPIRLSDIQVAIRSRRPVESFQVTGCSGRNPPVLTVSTSYAPSAKGAPVVIEMRAIPRGGRYSIVRK